MPGDAKALLQREAIRFATARAGGGPGDVAALYAAAFDFVLEELSEPPFATSPLTDIAYGDCVADMELKRDGYRRG